MTEDNSDLFDPALTLDVQPQVEATYTEDEIKTLDWKEHIRLRPGMYIGKLGDGSKSDDGIYVLIKEVLDNAIDEYMMGYGRQVSIDVTETTVTVRDYGRGIPLGKLVDVASIINTGAKYDNKAFKKSVGLNGVGIKAVNALSSSFVIQANRDGMARRASSAAPSCSPRPPTSPPMSPTAHSSSSPPTQTSSRDTASTSTSYWRW